MSGGVQRGHVYRGLRPSPRQPINADPDDATENRALFSKDAERQAAIEVHKKRVAKALRDWARSRRAR